MEILENHFRERALALLIVRAAGASTPDARLTDYGPAAEAEAIAARVAVLAAATPDERAEAVVDQLAGLRAAESVVLMSEIHPGWLTDILAQESPRVVGLLLRYLPSQHARAVLEQLPPGLRNRLPHIVDAFAVSDTIQRIVRRRFESRFLPVRPRTTLDQFTFATLDALSIQEWQVLLHDLGIHEMALALGTLNRAAVRVIFNRLDFADAKALHARLAAVQSADPRLARDARYCLLELSLEASTPSQLLREIGIQALARALALHDLPMLARIKQKLPPAQACLLGRDADMALPNAHAQLTGLRQREILLRIGVLSREGLIDARYHRLLSPELGAAKESSGDEAEVA